MVSIDGPENKCQRATGLPPGWLGNVQKKNTTFLVKRHCQDTTLGREVYGLSCGYELGPKQYLGYSLGVSWALISIF